MNLKNAIEWWGRLGDKLRTDLGERVWKSISNVRIFEAVKSFITHSARFTVGVCKPSQSARIRKVQSRKKAHNPLRTLWVGHVTIEYTNLSPFRAPMLWFINLTVATCHIQYTSLSLCHFFYTRKRTKHENTPFSYDMKIAADYNARKALAVRELLQREHFVFNSYSFLLIFCFWGCCFCFVSRLFVCLFGPLLTTACVHIFLWLTLQKLHRWVLGLGPNVKKICKKIKSSFSFYQVAGVCWNVC